VPFAALADHTPVLMGLTELALPAGDPSPEAGSVFHVHDNPASCRFFGLPAGGTTGRWARELGVPRDVEVVWVLHYRRALAARAPVTFDYAFADAVAGSTRRLAVTVTPLGLGDAGRPRFAYVAEDVTERHEARAAVQAHEGRLRRVLDTLTAFVGVLTPEGRVVEANRAPLERAGLALGDVVGRPFWETPWWAHDAEEQARVRDAVRRAAGGETVRYDAVVSLGDARAVIDFTLAPLVDDAGRVTHLVPSAVDVTERVAAEAAMRESETALRAALKAGALGTWDIDLASGLVARSGSTDAFFGLAPVAGPRAAEDFLSRIHPEDRSAVREAIRASVEEGVDHVVDYRVVRDDGTVRHLASRGEVVRDAAGHAVRLLGALVDVTVRAQALAAAEAARLAAEEASRVKGDFLATMSHELRTPLNGIAGHVQLLDMGIHGPVTEAQRTALGRIDRAQRHLLGLINDVLSYARIEAGKVEYDVRVVDLADVVAEVTPMVEPQLAARGVTLETAVVAPPGDGGALLAWADRDKLRQVLLNLLSNAGKFTGAGGRVTVSVSVADAERLARLPSLGDAVFVRVADTGRGIPREQLEAIFEPFVQVRSGSTYTRTADGTGLGLSISRDLTRGMGGELRVRSTVGAGSAFTLTLRRAVDADGTATDRRLRDERRADERRSGEDRRDDEAEG
jgi:PAS domain S-box-containing protein